MASDPPDVTRSGWRLKPRHVLGVLAFLLALNLALFGGWMLLLYAIRGSRGMWDAVAEFHTPYSHLYQASVRGLASVLLPAARPGEEITPRLKFEAPWPQGLGAAVATLSILLIIWLYRRERTATPLERGILAVIRVSLVLLAMFMLSEAVLSVDRTGLPYFIVLADTSASSGISDEFENADAGKSAEALARATGSERATRLAVAQGWLQKNDNEILRELQKQHKLRVYAVSGAAQQVTEIDPSRELGPAVEAIRKLEPAGSQSRLGDAVRQVLTELRGAPPTAILFLTDGQTTDGESLATAAEFAKSRNVPIFTVGLGDPAPTRDLELSDLLVDDVVFVEDQVRFQARLTGHGFAGQSVEVVLKRRKDDGTSSTPGEEVERVTVVAPPDGQVTPIELRHQPKETGEFIYSLEIQPRPRELLVENNRIDRSVNVREEKLRVLLVEGEPRYEFRYLLSFLKRDKTIELRTVLQSSDPEFSEQEATALPTFPNTTEGADGLFSFDVILFGDVEPGLLTATQMLNLVEFVEKRGGGLLFVAGNRFDPLQYRDTPLEPLFPIKLEDARDPAATGSIAPFRPMPTPEGRSHPIFRLADDEASSARVWQELPQLDWFLEASRKQELAFVLATHSALSGSDGPLPLLLYHYVGGGRVMLQAYDETWKWRFRVGDRFFGRYWVQMIRFLARSKLLNRKGVELVTDHARYGRTEPVRFQVRFPNPALAPSTGNLIIQVDQKGRPPRRVELNRSPGTANQFEGALPPLSEGQYEARLLPPPVLEGGMPTATFRVDPPADEFAQVRMNEPELVRAAELSGGSFQTTAQPIADLLRKLPPPQLVPLDTDPPVPLWNSPALLGLFLALLVAEWVLRKRKQLV